MEWEHEKWKHLAEFPAKPSNKNSRHACSGERALLLKKYSSEI